MLTRVADQLRLQVDGVRAQVTDVANVVGPLDIQVEELPERPLLVPKPGRILRNSPTLRPESVKLLIMVSFSVVLRAPVSTDATASASAETLTEVFMSPTANMMFAILRESPCVSTMPSLSHVEKPGDETLTL